MAKRFKRRRDGRVVARLEEAEIALLARLFADVQTLLEPDSVPTAPSWAADLGLDDLAGDPTRAATPPDDTALARLLPDARRDDPVAAEEFRRLTERSLRERKRAAHHTALAVLQGWSEDAGATQTMDRAEAHAFTAALTDVRLVLADRLGIETDEDAEAVHLAEDGDPSDPEVWLAMVYDFTTWVQESLTGVLLESLPEEGDGRRTPPGGA
jgi:hypothetical protein